MRLPLLVTAQALAVSLLATGGPPASAGLLVEHRPIYAPGSGPVTYTATAQSPIGLERIDLGFVARRLQCADGVPTLHEIVDEGQVSLDSGPDPTPELTISETFGPFPINTWITIRATARRPNGTFFVHRYHHTANLDGLVISCIGAIPIYIGGRGTFAPSNFNFLFVADPDFKTAGEYLARVGDIVFDYPDVGTPATDVGILDDRQFGRVKDRINLFLNEFAFKGEAGCPSDAQKAWVYPANDPRKKLPFLDVYLFTHETDFQDCASLSQPSKTGDPGTAGVRLPAVAGHELGHALLGLQDEYVSCFDCGTDALGPHPNVFPSEQACRNHVIAEHPFGDEDRCRTFNFQQRWRWCPAGDLMDMNTDLSGPAVGEEVAQLAGLVSALPTSGALPGGTVRSAPPRGFRAVPALNRDLGRTFGGRSLRVRMERTAVGAVTVLDVAVVRGASRLPRGVTVPILDATVPPPPTLEVRIDDVHGRTFYHYLIPDRRGGRSGPGPAGARPRPTDVVADSDWDIVIPWTPRIRSRAALFRLVDGDGNVLTEVPLRRRIPGPR